MLYRYLGRYIQAYLYDSIKVYLPVKERKCYLDINNSTISSVAIDRDCPTYVERDIPVQGSVPYFLCETF